MSRPLPRPLRWRALFASVTLGAGSVVGFVEDALGLFSGEAALAGKVIRLRRNLTIGDRFGDWFLLLSHGSNHSIVRATDLLATR